MRAISRLIPLIFSMTIMIQLSNASSETKSPRDFQSFSNANQIRVKHIDLDLTVLFDKKIIRGRVDLTIERVSVSAGILILDEQNLKIIKAEVSPDGREFSPVRFSIGDSNPIMGSPLSIFLPEKAVQVRIEYETSPSASGLQWLTPEQTAGKKQPYMYTQSESIHARSWIPLQDSPQVRVTYRATIHTPPDLLAVMSAEMDRENLRGGLYKFNMPQPVPSYLIAMAVGELSFKSLGPRSGVYAEPSVVDKAATEFSDVEKMISAIEKLYGPYRWGRYDILVLPPSFPLGGMENPRLTFATPTILAGDKSLVSLITHELAHSWSGNLVSNATWDDIWLNEGITVYVERRIIEALYGTAREEMESVLGRQDLENEMVDLKPEMQSLYVDLKDRDPEDVFSLVPYEKGALFLRSLEETFGRKKFDAFLKNYFEHFAFHSISTADFAQYLRENLFSRNQGRAEHVKLDEWLYRPGIPANAPRAVSDAFKKVSAQADRWLRGQDAAKDIRTAEWSTQEWLHFLRYLPEKLDKSKLDELDRAFRFTETGNAEIEFQWLLIAIRNNYQAAYPRLEQFLQSIGRRKLIRPLYSELMKTPEGRMMAINIYKQARPGYHPLVVTTIDEIVKK